VLGLYRHGLAPRLQSPGERMGGRVMAACERCWSMSGGDPDEYARLIATQSCTPEQQAGEDRTECKRCGRRTVHQYAKRCTACLADAEVTP
jgi:hypothetical protein